MPNTLSLMTCSGESDKLSTQICALTLLWGSKFYHQYSFFITHSPLHGFSWAQLPSSLGWWENQSVQKDKQRLGSLPSIPHSTFYLENACGESISYTSEVEEDKGGRVQPIPLSPVF